MNPRTYSVVYSDQQLYFIQLVEKQIEEGWKPRGPVSVALDQRGQVHYAQSFTPDKRKKMKDPE